MLHGPIHINGSVEGQIKTKSQVLIGVKGTVCGSIEADHLVLGGTFKGAARARSVELLSGSLFEGDIYATRCSCEVGGKIMGKIHPVTLKN